MPFTALDALSSQPYTEMLAFVHDAGKTLRQDNLTKLIIYSD
jgi:hypothetical protein